ncbi:MAG: peptide/nickel transport system substrate-binding protein [Chloroflexota bacterium]|jgi:peptide/nickel transport system substrate-binding protein|nr:peptide/nickel transport system substrate-binding protein [Chloroflexota bacterium]
MRRAFSILLCTLVLVVACTATPPASSTTGPIDPRQTTLMIGVGLEPQTFDPHVNIAEISSYRYHPNVYETLVQYAPDGTIKGLLADSWTISADGLTYRFKLKPGVKFSDGTPFNAEAVKANFDRVKTLNKGPVTLYAPINQITPVDETTVDFVLKAPYAPLLAILAGWQSGLFISPTAWKTNDAGGGDLGQKWLNEHTAGTGAFTLESWKPNDRVTLVRNPNYREAVKATDIQRIVYPLIAEPATRRQQMASGDIDILEELTPSIVDQLKGAPGVKVEVNFSVGSPFGQTVFMNLKKKPFDDVNVRRAISYAIDYKRLVAVWNGLAVQATGFFPDVFKPWFSGETVVYQQDLTKAADYLRRAGLSMPMNPRLKFNVLWQAGQTSQRDMLQLVKEDLAKIGIDLEVVSAEIPQWREAVWTKNYDMAIFQSAMRYADPDAIMSLVVHSSVYQGQFNPGILDPAIDGLIEKGRATADPAQRRTVYNDLQKILTDNAYLLYLVNKQQAWAYRTNVTGIVWNSNYGPRFNGNEIKKTSAK